MFIRLTYSGNTDEVFVNVNQIEYFRDFKDSTRVGAVVYGVNTSFSVNESAGLILEMIESVKQAELEPA